MKDEEKSINRFAEYIKTAESINQEKSSSGGYSITPEEIPWYSDGSPEYIPQITSVDVKKTKQWGLKCLYLLEINFGKASNYYKEFDDEYKRFDSEDNYKYFSKAFEILKAAKDDFEIRPFNNQLSNNTTLLSDSKNSDLSRKETLPKYEDVLSNISRSCDAESHRNTRIYLILIFESLILISSPFFYFFGLKYAFIFTLIILLVSYIISALSLKEWTPTKLPERIIEIEKDRIYKRFNINSE